MPTDTWSFPLETAFQAAAAINAGEDPTRWPVPGGKLNVTVGAGLSALAWGYSARALIYVEDTANTYGASEVGNLVPRVFAGTSVTVAGLADGQYTVEVWNTRAPGGRLSTLSATSAAGSLTFPAPTIDRDAFYKIIPLASGGGGGTSVQVYDTGIRTVAPGGLGSADTGGVWTIGGTTTDYAVNGGQLALIGSIAGATRRGALLSTLWQEQDVHVKVQSDKVPTGATQQVYLMARAQDLENNYYRATVVFKTDNTISIQIDKIIAGVNTNIAAAVTPGRDTFTVNTEYWLRLSAAGVSPTTLSAKVWKAGTTEPVGWDVTITDSTAPLQGTGATGVRAYVGAATNTPVTFRFDELQGLDTTGGVTGTAGLTAHASPVASGSVGISGTVAIIASASESATGSIVAAPGAKLTASASISATGFVGNVTGTVALTASVSIAASGVPFRPNINSRALVVPAAGVALGAPDTYPAPAYQKLEITTQFWGGNSFIMTIGGADAGASALVTGALLWLPDEDDAVYEIETVQTDKSGASRANALLTVAGRSVDGFIGDERRILPDPGADYDSVTGVASETAMKHYVRSHAGVDADAARQIPNLVVAPDLAQGTIVSMDARFQTVGDVLLQIGLLGPLGWKTSIDRATGNIIWDVVDPADRSASVFFDFDFGTISAWQDTESLLNSSTLAVVAGQGDLKDRDVEIRYQGAEPTGFDRREAFIDARDVTLGDLATLDARGDAFLVANAPTRSTSATIYQFGSFQPGRDWFLGDIVLLHDAVAGVNESARVVKLVKTYDVSASAPTIVASVGKPFPGVANALAAPAGGAPDASTITLGDVKTIVDNAVADLSVGGGNMVVNSSFENVNAAWTAGPNWTEPYTAFGIDGVNSARIQLVGQVAGDLVTSAFIAVTPTDDYWVSFWSYLQFYTSGVARFSVREYDATGTLLATTNVDLSAVELAPTRWSVHFGVDNTTPNRVAWNASTTKVKLAFLTPAAATLTWMVDAVQLERGKLLSSYAPAPGELIDGSVGTTQISDNAITTQKVIANAITTGKIAAGAITTALLNASAVIANVVNVGGTVTIDSTGIAITGGKLTMTDRYGVSALTGSGFSGNWLDFISDGLYDSSMRAGIVGAIANGSTTAVPAWTVTVTNGSTAGVSDSSWPGGYYIEGTPTALNHFVTVVSAMVPVTPFASVTAIGVFAWVRGGTSQIGTRLTVTFYAADGTTLIQAASMIGVTAVTSLTTPASYRTSPISVPAGARFATLALEISQTVNHSSSTRLRVGGGALIHSPVVGSQAAAYQDGVGPFSVWTGSYSVTYDQTVLVPIQLTAPMIVAGCAVYEMSTSLSRSFEWRLYYDPAPLSATLLVEVPGLNGTRAWTASGAGIQSSAPAVGYLTVVPAGCYWLAIHNTHSVQPLVLKAAANALGSGAALVVSPTGGVLGSTFDPLTSAGTSSLGFGAWLQGIAAMNTMG